MTIPWILAGVSHAAAQDLQAFMEEAIGLAGGGAGGWTCLAEREPLSAGFIPFEAVVETAAKVRGVIAERSLPFDAAVIPAAGFSRKRLLISDMDSTIIGQECIDEIADAIGLKPQIAEITERAMRGELDFEAALTERVAMLKGLPLDALARTLEERITLNPGARTLIATMKAHGARTLLVSGGFTYFTARVAELAGFDSHQGNTLIDDGGALTGEVGLPILGRQAKRDALVAAAAELDTGPEDSLALGDGANDLDMIRASGLGIAYRAKPVVAAEAAGAIRHTDLTAALYFQGFTAAELVHRSDEV